MNRTSATVLIAGTIGAAAILGGFFLVQSGDTDSPAAATATTDQEVAITALEHLTDKKLAGVKVRVIDLAGATVGKQDTTDSQGLATVIVPGATDTTYRIVAIAPDETWEATVDTDGSSSFGSIACADILGTFDPDTCIYMHRDAAGTLTMPNRGNGSQAGISRVGDATFRFDTPKTTTTEPIGEQTEPIEETRIGDDPAGEPVDEVATEDESETTSSDQDGPDHDDADENTDAAGEDISTAEPVTETETETFQVCASFAHVSPDDAPRFPSRIEVDVDAGPERRDLVMTIPGANDGQPVVIDVSTDTSVFGISSYGDYKIGNVVLDGNDVTSAFAALATITVDDEPATVWCNTIETAQPTEVASITDTVTTFVAGFSAAHESGDVDALLAGLHPTAREAFGAEACDNHVRNTAGLISDIEIIGLGDPTPYVLATPTAEIVFDSAVRVDANWTENGQRVEGIRFHVVTEADSVHYLSTCGQPSS